MRAHQVYLQLANLIPGNADVAEFANAGSDRIGKLVSRDQFSNHRARAIHALARVRREQHGTAIDCDVAHVFEGQIISVDV